MAKALHVFSVFAAGRPQRRLVNIARADPDIRHQVISFAEDDDEVHDLPQTVEVEVFSAKRGVFGDLPNLVGLRHRMASIGPDVVCTYGLEALGAVLACLDGAPTPHVHFEDDEAESGEDPAARGRRVRSAALAGATIVVASRQLEMRALKEWRAPGDRLRRVPFGVDLERFSVIAESETERRTVTVGTIGALVLSGNLPRLIRSFSAMRSRVQAELAIFGHGPARPELEGRARAAGARSRIFFLPPPPDAETVFRDLDVYADPGGADPFAAEAGLIEAMAAGLPVLLPASDEARAALSLQNARFLPAMGDEKGYAVALTKLVNDFSLRRRLGAANLEKARDEFSLKKTTEEHLEILRAALRQDN